MPGLITHVLGLDGVLRRAACDRLQAQSQIARIRDGKIAHHAPALPVLYDASPVPAANEHALARRFARATRVTAPPAEGADLVFAAFGMAIAPVDFAAVLRPQAAFVIVCTTDLTDLAADLKNAGLTVTHRRHLAGFGQSLAGVKPIAAPHDRA